jgi:phosphatidate phosphatase PAH1
MWWIDADDCFVGEYLLRGHQKIHQLKLCYDSNSTTTRKEKFHSINNYMHRRRTVVWTQRNGTHSEVAYKPQYPMITVATLNESIKMKIVATRKDYRENWKFSILKEHVFHSPLEILLFNQQSFTSTIYAGVIRLTSMNLQKKTLKYCKNNL